MSLVLDAGALIAYEKGSRDVQAMLETAEEAGEALRTSTAVVAQAWRDGARQAHLAQLLRGVEEVELTSRRARNVGTLLRRARSKDVVDATLVELAGDGDEILTSDPGDLQKLAQASGKTLIITRVS